VKWVKRECGSCEEDDGNDGASDLLEFDPMVASFTFSFSILTILATPGGGVVEASSVRISATKGAGRLSVSAMVLRETRKKNKASYSGVEKQGFVLWS
jgi:hypothetical protein